MLSGDRKKEHRGWGSWQGRVAAACIGWKGTLRSSGQQPGGTENRPEGQAAQREMDAPTCRERLAAVRLPEGNTATTPGHGEEADAPAHQEDRRAPPVGSLPAGAALWIWVFAHEVVYEVFSVTVLFGGCQERL